MHYLRLIKDVNELTPPESPHIVIPLGLISSISKDCSLGVTDLMDARKDGALFQPQLPFDVLIRWISLRSVGREAGGLVTNSPKRCSNSAVCKRKFQASLKP
jgi:hypothetical protein